MTTKTNSIDKSAANAALSAFSEKVNGPRGAKKAEKQATKEANREARKGKLLAELTSGQVEGKSRKWNPRTALVKAVSAVKNGATAEELQACTALQAVAKWSDAAEPVAQYAEAKGAAAATVLAGLNATPAEAKEPAPEQAPAPEPVAAKPERKPAVKRQSKPRQPAKSKVA
jgi:hypothetical protein